MKKTFILSLCIMLLFLLCSCSKKDKEKVYKAEGGYSAFDEYVSDRVSTLKGKTITYGTKNCPTEYRNAMDKATDKLSKTSSSFSFKVNTNLNSGAYTADVYDSSNPNYVFYYNGTWYSLDYGARNGIPMDYFMAGSNAFNSFTNKSDYSKIYFNTSYMDGYSQEVKTMLAMHELGHTIGFIDFDADKYVYKNDATVMKFDYRNGYTVFEDYTEFDKQCIEDVYGK